MENSTVTQLAGIDASSPLGAALQQRANILDYTHQAEAAVLRPEDPGAWPHALRSAMASRIAKLNAADDLAEHFAKGIDDDRYLPVANPDNDGNDLALTAVLSFMDRVASQPRDTCADDVSKLQSAGISDADIVRLAEINAFLAYQLRLIAGLQLLAGENS